LAGGVGNSTHILSGLKDPRVDAVATAHLFNFIGDGLKNARSSLMANGIDLPIWDIQSLEQQLNS
jgi:cyclase